MGMRNFKRNFEEIATNPKTMVWAKFFIEAMVAVIVGLAIGYLTTSFAWTCIIVAMLILPLFIYGVILVYFEHKMSVIDMLNREIKNRHYENVIMLGMQISNTLFKTKQNENRVRVGRKVQKAILMCDRELGDITIEGRKMSKEYVFVKLNIDDLGWSLYQDYKGDWPEAVETIKMGVKEAETESFRLFKLGSDYKKESLEFLQMALKGYRHSTGIFLDKDIARIKEANFNENVIKLIISCGRIINMKGVCIGRNTEECKGESIEECTKNNDEEKQECIKRNIVDLFETLVPPVELTNTQIWKYITDSQEESKPSILQIEDIERLRHSISIYATLSDVARKSLINDLYYTFARNNVKRIRINRDDERKHKIINEAISYASLYVGEDIGKNSNKAIRFDSLMNEILLEEANSDTILGLIDKIERTIRKCTTRTDLYFRNSALLIYAFTLRYKFLIKGNDTFNKHKKILKIKELEHGISNVISNVKREDRHPDEEFEKAVQSAKEYFKQEKSILRKAF